jgi:hypothetical protein
MPFGTGTSRGSSYEIPTPRGEEAERLDWWYDRADELCWMSEARQVEEEQYCKLAQALDDEGVGEYFRALCDFHNFSVRPRPELHPLRRGYPMRRLPLEPGRPKKVRPKERAGPQICKKRPSSGLAGPDQ